MLFSVAPVAFLQWVASCTWAPDANPCQTPLSDPRAWKNFNPCQLFARWLETFNSHLSIFRGVQPSTSYPPLCQPCTLFQQNLHLGFKLGLCWVCQFIKQKQKLIQKQFLFLFQQVLLPIWDNNGHLAISQCNTYIVLGVVSTQQGLCLAIILSRWHGLWHHGVCVVDKLAHTRLT